MDEHWYSVHAILYSHNWWVIEKRFKDESRLRSRSRSWLGRRWSPQMILCRWGLESILQWGEFRIVQSTVTQLIRMSWISDLGSSRISRLTPFSNFSKMIHFCFIHRYSRKIFIFKKKIRKNFKNHRKSSKIAEFWDFKFLAIFELFRFVLTGFSEISQ